MQVNPPPDVNVGEEGKDLSNWQAGAANMLAIAGYGIGTDIQTRAESIYSEINGHFGSNRTGWTDAALEWWLSSEHNIWPDNPYKVVDVIGHKGSDKPFASKTLPTDMGMMSRNGDILAVTITWPPVDPQMDPSGSNVLVFVGDDHKKNNTSGNPKHIRVTDPHRNAGGAIQTYPYDYFDNPNPDGLNSGSGWYIAYDQNHPFIKNVTVLKKVKKGSNVKLAFYNLASYKVSQPDPEAASAFKFVCEADTVFLDYELYMDRNPRRGPELMEKVSNNQMISVEWNLTGRNASEGRWLTISTAMTLPGRHHMTYRDIQFRLGKNNLVEAAPRICWKIEFEPVDNTRITNISGGYIIGSVEVHKPDTLANSGETLAELRFSTRHDISESLLYHSLFVCGEEGYETGRIRLGNSFGKLTPAGLWEFDNWLTEIYSPGALSDTLQHSFHWNGDVLYPSAGSYYERIPVVNP